MSEHTQLLNLKVNSKICLLIVHVLCLLNCISANPKVERTLLGIEGMRLANHNQLSGSGGGGRQPCGEREQNIELPSPIRDLF